MSSIIRKAVGNDLGIVYRFLCELENEDLDFDAFKSIYIENISNPKNLYMVSESDNVVSGFISFHIQNLLHHSGLVGEIQEFYIDKTFRGKGIGKLLIDEIKNYAKQNNLKSIEVTSSKKRTENVLMYEKLGFMLSHNKFTIYDI
jgi:PhnO protein